MVKKYNITIKDTLHTNKECLASMIRTLVGNRKSVEKFDGLGIPKRKKFRRAGTLQKKISSES